MKKVFLFTLAILFLFVSAAIAADITIRWDRNNETDLAGYKLYKTLVPGSYGWDPASELGITGPNTITDANLQAIIPVTVVNSTDQAEHPNEFTVRNVDDGHWYFVLTAFDVPIDVGGGASVTTVLITGQYNESGFSNEVNQRVDTGAPAPPGGFNIWEVIIGFFRKLFSFFA